MTALRKRMLEELQRRKYSPETIRLYLTAVHSSLTIFKNDPTIWVRNICASISCIC